MSDKESLLEACEKFRSALFANDVSAMNDLMAEEYVGFNPLGNPQDRRTSIDAYQPGCVKLTTYDVEDVAVRIVGEVGIMTGKGLIRGNFAGCEFEHKLRFLDLYIHRDGRWQLYLSQVTPLGET